MRKNTGVTLIVLVVTIIVLVILAGVGILALVKNNNVIDKSGLANEKTNEEHAKELVEFEVTGSFSTTGNLDIEDLNNNLINNCQGIELKGEDDLYSVLSDSKKIKNLPAFVKYKNVELEIGITGKVTISGNDSNSEKYLVDEVDIGQYIDIGVEYNNKQGDLYGNVHSEINGWRVLKKVGSGENGYIKVISEGCPLTYSFDSDDSIEDVLKELEDLSFIHLINDEEERGFTNNGFASNDLKSVFNNGLIDLNKTIHSFSCGQSGLEDEYMFLVATKYDGVNEFEELYRDMSGERKNMAELWESVARFGDEDFSKVIPWKWQYSRMFNYQYDEDCGLRYLLGGSYYIGVPPACLLLVGDDGCLQGCAGTISDGVRVVTYLKPGLKKDSLASGDGMSRDSAIEIEK